MSSPLSGKVQMLLTPIHHPSLSERRIVEKETGALDQLHHDHVPHHVGTLVLVFTGMIVISTFITTYNSN